MKRYFAVFTLVLSACGGGGGGGGGGVIPDVSATVDLSGTAAVGAAISNTKIDFGCRSETYTRTTDSNGNFSLKLPKAQLPCLLETMTAGSEKLHSFANGTAANMRVNVTPLTELVMTQLLGELPSDFAARGGKLSEIALSGTDLEKAVLAVSTGLKSIVDFSSYDVFGNAFVVGDAFDLKLDALAFGLSNRGKSLSEVRGLFVEKLADGTARADHVANALKPVDGGSGTGPSPFPDFAKGFYRLVTGIDGSSQRYYEYSKLADVAGVFSVRDLVVKPSAKVFSERTGFLGLATFQYLDSTGTWRNENYNPNILSNADLVAAGTGYGSGATMTLDLKFTDGSAFTKVQLEGLQSTDISGKKLSTVFNAAYVPAGSYFFDAGSTSYVASIKFLEPVYSRFKNNPSLQFSTLQAFRERYTSNIFCGNLLSSTTTEFGIRFDASGNGAKLIPVDGSCVQKSGTDQSVPVNWEEVSVLGKNHLRIYAEKMPGNVGFSLAASAIVGGYDASAVNPNLSYATDRYELYFRVEDSQSLVYGKKVLTGASSSFRPGNGPWLNRKALDSILTAASYPSTLD